MLELQHLDPGARVRKKTRTPPARATAVTQRMRDVAAVRPCGRRRVSGPPEANARHRSSHGHGQQRAWEERAGDGRARPRLAAACDTQLCHLWAHQPERVPPSPPPSLTHLKAPTAIMVGRPVVTPSCAHRQRRTHAHLSVCGSYRTCRGGPRSGALR